MNGRVGLESVLGQGSTFWAELPLRSSAPATAPTDTEESDLKRLFHARVLMVEDNPVNMMIAVAMLEHWGVRVAQAFDGRMAVAAVHEAVRNGDPFDAVVMDVQMPRLSGYVAARLLKEDWATADIPVVLLTSLDAASASSRSETSAAAVSAMIGSVFLA